MPVKPSPNCCILFILVLAIPFFGIAQPKITAFAPISGPVGASVTITGSNFSSTRENNIVRFGAQLATVTAVGPSSLTVTVPTGTTFQSISMTTNNLTAYSNKPFIPNPAMISCSSGTLRPRLHRGSGLWMPTISK